MSAGVGRSGRSGAPVGESEISHNQSLRCHWMGAVYCIRSRQLNNSLKLRPIAPSNEQTQACEVPGRFCLGLFYEILTAFQLCVTNVRNQLKSLG
jgi:hypothetical protein